VRPPPPTGEYGGLSNGSGCKFATIAVTAASCIDLVRVDMNMTR